MAVKLIQIYLRVTMIGSGSIFNLFGDWRDPNGVKAHSLVEHQSIVVDKFRELSSSPVYNPSLWRHHPKSHYSSLDIQMGMECSPIDPSSRICPSGVGKSNDCAIHQALQTGPFSITETKSKRKSK